MKKNIIIKLAKGNALHKTSSKSNPENPANEIVFPPVRGDERYRNNMKKTSLIKLRYLILTYNIRTSQEEISKKIDKKQRTTKLQKSRRRSHAIFRSVLYRPRRDDACGHGDTWQTKKTTDPVRPKNCTGTVTPCGGSSTLLSELKRN